MESTRSNLQSCTSLEKRSGQIGRLFPRRGPLPYSGSSLWRLMAFNARRTVVGLRWAIMAKSAVEG